MGGPPTLSAHRVFVQLYSGLSQAAFVPLRPAVPRVSVDVKHLPKVVQLHMVGLLEQYFVHWPRFCPP